MYRDKELIRKIATIIESSQEPLHSCNMEIEGYNSDEIGYNCQLMDDARFVVTVPSSSRGDKYGTTVIRLTNDGHDFLDAARNDSIWNRATTIVKEKGIELSLSMFGQLLKKLAADSIGLPFSG